MKITLYLLLAISLGLGLVADQTVLAPDLIAPPTLAEIPELTIKYYEVTPKENESLMAAVLRAGPRDTSGIARVAETKWRIEWNWPVDAKGRPVLSQVKVNFSALIILPRLNFTVRVSADQKLRWQQYLAAVERHEAGHAWHAYQGSAELQELIRAAAISDSSFSPFDLKALAEPFVEKLHAVDRTFDRMTVHGRTQGVWWPPELS